MWLQFSLACVVCLFLLYCPGFLILASSGFAIWKAVALSPAICIAVYSCLAIAYPFLGIDASLASLSAPLIVVAFVWLIGVLVFRKKRLLYEESTWRNKPIDSIAIPFLYAVVGLVVGTYFFVRNLDSAASFYQAFDNVHHLNSIRAFLDSGNYSSFNSTLYVDAAGSLPSPFLSSTTAFYPSAWHALVAMIVQALGSPITVTINAVNAILLCVVFPLGAYALLDVLFDGKRRCVLFGAFLAVGFSASVWDFAIFGPLYPMLLSYALVPAVMSCFVRFLSGDVSPRSRLSYGLIFLVGCVGVALSQPAGIFLMGLLLTPYCVIRVAEFVAERKRDSVGRAAEIVAAMLIAAFWLLCYSLPSFRGLVEFNWAKSTSCFQAVVDVLMLSPTWHPVQLGLALLVIIGVFDLLGDRRRKWLVASYALTCFSYIVCVASEGLLKHILGGFWYTDPHRLAANVAIAALPIAVAGVVRLSAFVQSCIPGLIRIIGVSAEPDKRVSIGHGLMAVFLLLIYCPSFELKGIMSIDTAFGHYGNTVRAENDFNGAHVLTKDEMTFAREALSMIPEGSGIINAPNDGSGMLYALMDANVLYRSFDLPSIENEREESAIIRRELNQIETNDAVRSAVEDTGARYLLILDQGMESQETTHFWSYYPEQWAGIESVADDTPGFSIILARDDMRLYKIKI